MMQESVKTFFSPKGILIFGCILFYTCFAGINTIYFLQRWSYHGQEYEKTMLYYQQPVCQDSTIKSKTEGKNKCDQYAVELSTAPWMRALMDVFESNFICSGGSCSRWFSHLVMLFVTVTILLGYMFVRHTAWTMGKVEELRTSLPGIWSSPIYKVKKLE